MANNHALVSPSMIVRGGGGRKIGFLGLGTMGKGMASVLLDAFAAMSTRDDDDTKDALAVWNRTASKAETLKEKGASVATSPKEMAKSGCEIVYAMLADPTASKMVAEQFAEGLREHHHQQQEQHHHQKQKEGGSFNNNNAVVYVEMSTIDAETSETIKRVIEKDQRAEYLAAPVSGGEKDAKEGALLILAAGRRAAYEKCLVDFRRMGKQSWLMGPECKNATDAKMALQIMMGGQAALLAECLAFCEYAGVDEKVWFDVLDKGVMMNPLLKSVGNRMFGGVENNRQWPRTLFQTYLQQKDLKLAIETAEKVNCEVPIASAVHQRYVRASKKGHAYEDFAGVRDAYDEK